MQLFNILKKVLISLILRLTGPVLIYFFWMTQTSMMLIQNNQDNVKYYLSLSLSLLNLEWDIIVLYSITWYSTKIINKN